MSVDEFSRRFGAYRLSVEREAAELKDSYYALEKLIWFYEQRSPPERALADVTLSRWILSDDENLRFDALVLIDHFRIGSAAPALRQLIEILATSVAPSAPFETEKVRRVLTELTGSSPSGHSNF